jgi:hypothetical protein
MLCDQSRGGGRTNGAEDPELALWRRVEKQRKEEEQERHIEREWAIHSQAPRDFVDEPPRSRASNFVDVDGMKDEKVEQSCKWWHHHPKRKKKIRLL